MPPNTYGYVTELDDGRTMAERIDLMRTVGVFSDNILVEETGSSEIRPQLRCLLDRIRPGDMLIFECLYGLGHNYRTIADNLDHIDRCGSVRLVLLDMPLLCESAADSATSALISDAAIQTILYMARHLEEIREYRQRRGIDSAKARGTQFGRPKVDIPPEFDAIAERWRSGAITARDAAHLLNISRTTFFRCVKARHQ